MDYSILGSMLGYPLFRETTELSHNAIHMASGLNPCFSCVHFLTL